MLEESHITFGNNYIHNLGTVHKIRYWETCHPVYKGTAKPRGQDLQERQRWGRDPRECVTFTSHGEYTGRGSSTSPAGLLILYYRHFCCRSPSVSALEATHPLENSVESTTPEEGKWVRAWRLQQSAWEGLQLELNPLAFGGPNLGHRMDPFQRSKLEGWLHLLFCFVTGTKFHLQILPEKQPKILCLRKAEGNHNPRVLF